MTPEGKVKKQVVATLKKLGAYYFFPATGGYGRSGVPDVVACLDGLFIGIECKAGNNTLTELQKKELSKIRDSHGVTLCINEANINSLEPALINITSALRKAFSACVSNTGQGVLVVVTNNSIKLHGLNIGEKDALDLLRVAAHSYDCADDRTLQ